MRKAMMLVTVLGLSVAFVMAARSTAPAQGDTSGKVTLESKSVAIGVGVSWGDGVLEYRGRKYSFTVEGLSVLDLGVAKVTAHGEVKNLKKLEDFTGSFAMVAAGGGAGGGAGAALLKNQNGVEMALKATGQGVVLSAPRRAASTSSSRNSAQAYEWAEVTAARHHLDQGFAASSWV